VLVYRSLVTVLYLAFTASSAWAQAEAYRQADTLPLSERPAWLERASRSVGRVNMGSYCTATRISPQGHILTAFHCISACMYGAEFETMVREFSQGGSAWEFTRPGGQLGNLRCTSRRHGILEPKHYEWRRPMVVLAVAGRGYLSPKASVMLPLLDNDLFHEFRKEGFTALGDYDDFAILKEVEVDQAAPFLKVSCKKGFTKDERVWSYGYPYYHEGRNRHYYTPAYSHGQVLERIEYTSAIEDVNSGRLSRDSALRTYFDPKLFWTSLDVGVGASGAPVLNEQGEISGITIMKYTGNTRYTYDRGAHIAVSINHIRTELSRLLPKTDYEAIVDCP